MKTWDLNRESTKPNYEQNDKMVEVGSMGFFDAGDDDSGEAGRTRAKGGGARRHEVPQAASELAKLEEHEGAWRG